MKNFTKTEILIACEKEVNRLNAEIDTATKAKNRNRANNCKKAKVGVVNLEKLVSLCADNCSFDSEVYTKERDFEFMNIGTVAEQVVFHLRCGRVNLRKMTWGKGYDHKVKGIKAEYKACLSPISLNTPYTGKADVLLVNGMGIYFIPKEEAITLVNKYGRFKYNESYIDYVPDEMIDLCYKLMDAIGYDE